MEQNQVNSVSPHLPYDDSIHYQCQMYDNVTYTMNSTYDHQQLLAKESGNIIKSYRCCIIEPYEIRN